MYLLNLQNTSGEGRRQKCHWATNRSFFHCAFWELLVWLCLFLAPAEWVWRGLWRGCLSLTPRLAGCSLAGWPGWGYLTSPGSSVKWGLLHHGTHLIGSLQAGVLKHLVQAFSKHWHEASPSFILLCGLLYFTLHFSSPNNEHQIPSNSLLPTHSHTDLIYRPVGEWGNRVVSHAQI